ncbi:SLC13 family permease [Desulfoscipio gibsoniae]|uniref:ABC-type branched-chain amino acid transport system, periplasmic component n=1 Tax=Desulfoscipio gibsoniae DSM 7213 TaxID=767817 RepID=R4KNW3_9FIRM|nr:SLC13 family permease [Desulfoscipio gibsoniae]AGL02250.1 ABC-type branched-chain amino acid transport system, periplasmic component [Desulfoscipio gibsoniae DSM 7213]
MTVNSVGLDKLKLLDIPLFSGLDRMNLAKLVPVVEEVHYKTGDILFQQGEFGDSLYILARGKVKVFLEEGSQTRELAVLGERECFGEMSLLTGEPRSAGIQAVTDVVVLRLSKDNFDELLRNQNSLAVQFAGILARRLAQVNKEQANKKKGSEEQEPVKGEPQCVVDIPAPETLISQPDKDRAIPVLRAKLNKQQLLSVILAILGSLLLNLLLESQGFNRSQRILLDILFGGAILWSFNVFSFHMISCAMPLLAIFLRASRPETVLSGFTSPSLFMLLGLFAVSAAVVKTGLIYRLVLIVISRFPTGYVGQTLGWVLAGLLITPFLSFTNERVSLGSRMLRSYLDTLRLQNVSAGALGLAFSTLLGFGQLSFMVLSGAVACLFVYQLLPVEVRGEVTYALWLQAALPLSLVFLPLSYLTILLFFRSKEPFQLDHTVIEDQLIILGPITRQEKITLLALLFAFLGLLSYHWHGISGAAICLVSFLLLYGSAVLDDQSIRTEINWNVFISFGALVGFGSALFTSGLPALLADKLSPLLGFLLDSILLFLAVTVIWMKLLRFVLPALPALLVSLILFLPLSEASGINPFVIGLILLLASHTWFLSPEYNGYFTTLFKETGKNLLTNQQTFKLAFVSSFICILAVSFSLPFWKHLDLIVPVKTAQPAMAGAEQQVVIGLAGSFSDPEGLQLKNAVQMAVDEVNASGILMGRKISIEVKDDQGDVTRGMAIAQSLAENKEVVAVIGHRQSYISTQVAAIYDRAGLVMIVPSEVSPQLNRYHTVFSTLPGVDDFGILAARTMLDQGFKRTVICYADGSYGRSLANAFEDEVHARGMKIADRLAVSGGINEWNNLLSKWQILGYDSIFLIDTMPAGAEWITGARRAGLKVPIFAASGLDAEELPRLAGSAAEGTTIFSIFNPGENHPEVEKFIRDYQVKFGADPGVPAAQGYDAVKILVEAMKGTAAAEPAQIAAKLRQMKEYHGITGTHSFTEDGRVAGKEIVVKKVREGKITCP